jgi:hypothetical protein
VMLQCTFRVYVLCSGAEELQASTRTKKPQTFNKTSDAARGFVKKGRERKGNHGTAPNDPTMQGRRVGKGKEEKGKRVKTNGTRRKEVLQRTDGRAKSQSLDVTGVGCTLVCEMPWRRSTAGAETCAVSRVQWKTGATWNKDNQQEPGIGSTRVSGTPCRFSPLG